MKKTILLLIVAFLCAGCARAESGPQPTFGVDEESSEASYPEQEPESSEAPSDASRTEDSTQDSADASHTEVGPPPCLDDGRVPKKSDNSSNGSSENSLHYWELEENGKGIFNVESDVEGWGDESNFVRVMEVSKESLVTQDRIDVSAAKGGVIELQLGKCYLCIVKVHKAVDQPLDWVELGIAYPKNVSSEALAVLQGSILWKSEDGLGMLSDQFFYSGDEDMVIEPIVSGKGFSAMTINGDGAGIHAFSPRISETDEEIMIFEFGFNGDLTGEEADCYFVFPFATLSIEEAEDYEQDVLSEIFDIDHIDEDLDDNFDVDRMDEGLDGDLETTLPSSGATSEL